MTAPRTYRGMLFDLGGVIVRLDFEQVLSELGRYTSASRDDVAAFLDTAPATLALEKGDLSPRQYFLEVQRLLQFRGDYGTFVRLWNGWVSEDPPMVALLTALKRRFPIGFISNTNVLHMRRLFDASSFLRPFDRCIASCFVGSCKPEPRIYQIAIARMGLPAEEIIYIDDRPVCVDAGHRAGLCAIQFHGHDALANTLNELGIAWEHPHLQPSPIAR